jgi:hypothetical protein
MNARTLVVAMAALGVMAASACAHQAGPGTASGLAGGSAHFAATPAYLARAAHQSAAEPYRVESTTHVGSRQDADSGAFVTQGDVAGDRVALTFDADPTPAGQPRSPALAGVDTTMDVVVVPGAVYLRSPLFAALEGIDGPVAGLADPGPLSVLADLGDRWGRIAVGADDEPFDGLEVLGLPVGDPRGLVARLREAGGARDLGAGTVRGVAVRGVGATLHGVKIRVWVDAHDRVRRIETTDAPAVRTVTDLYDYGGAAIAVGEPLGAVDITDRFGPDCPCPATAG